MRRQILKTCTVLLISFVLVYYSVAGVVLSCFYDEDHARNWFIDSDVSSYQYPVTIFPAGRAHDAIDCAGANYHVESLAVLKSLVSPDRFSGEFRSISGHSPNSLTVANGLLIRIIFQLRPALAPPSEVALYLSLSVLRI